MGSRRSRSRSSRRSDIVEKGEEKEAASRLVAVVTEDWKFRL